jgi:UDP:flavonoid glycosyltransferase YjiC (YdhE family)
VVVALGGGTHPEEWRAVLNALFSELASFDLLPGFGPVGFEAGGPGFRVANPDEAAARMAGAHLAVSAAGTTALELAFLGVPSVLVAVAANQRPTARALAERGAAVDLGDLRLLGAETLRSAVLRLLASPDTRRSMRERGRAILDGRGVERVAAALREGVDFRRPRRLS